MLHSFHGTLSFSLQKKEIPGFKHFLKTVEPSQYLEDIYFSNVWFQIFDCSLVGSHCGTIGDCLPNSSFEFISISIDMMTLSESSYFIYNAVCASQLSKESACNAEDPGSIPGLERSPGEGNGNPLQYSCLENPMERGLQLATAHGVARVEHNLATKPPPTPLLCMQWPKHSMKCFWQKQK